MHYGNSSIFNFTSSNINKPILDLGNTYDTLGVFQGMNMSNYYIQEVKVTIDTILHANDGDLEISLIHQGVTDTLIFQVGGTGDSFIGTELNDSASTPIMNGSAPYTGEFMPTGSLSQFNNLDPSGNWILKVYDRATGNTGTLQSWSLTLRVSNLTGIEPVYNNVPGKYTLFQNYPNPFNPTTNIKFAITKAGMVNMTVYDVNGRKVEELVNSSYNTGTYEVNWNASKYSSGVYFYTIRTNEFSETKRMVLIK